ncbi:PA2169 family four-helix-bundle protein [Pseudomonas berkeleyensis]|uniref:PA2169 family four-helix-bundle protein n=1 Tax=Pseudomonas berkeleyensis TaxID=2726956 RepID=A0A7G5DW10_9PSED|nr:PA2169 family four-helix-bundle protein [Pseudomonas berkeleyensis]QMV65935.1 PA2169 family four-helix-bundle protein [Pseudomonas berkeleyensis]WSO41424.1 PA2169 family four-helix-bundle protein [Pseudomonas berkeleyensis]
MDIADDRKALIRTLNKLIETCKDGEAGFKVCAEDIKRPDIKQLFTQRSRQCAEAAEELQRAVLEFGGQPEDSTSIGADLHRRWVDLKSLITGKDEAAILNEAERGEDVAKERYSEALSQDLPTDIRAIVQRQYEGVLRNHDEVRALRDVERARS